jgi:hypothetical protein
MSVDPQSVDPQFIRVGMEVVGTDGELAGTVKAVGLTDFHLDRPMARDLLVPLSAVQVIISGAGNEGTPRLLLNIRGASVGSVGWPHPE